MKKFFHPPKFWQTSSSLWAKVLWPISQCVTLLGRRRRLKAKTFAPGVPVICVGNVTVGGSGKTPLVIFLARLLKEKGFNPHILSRGYGVKLKCPTLVTSSSTAQEVGDEPLLLAKAAPTWVFPDRVVSAKKAVTAGADCLLMDDGFQNPFLYQHIKLLVVDTEQGMGNGYVLPAGPLREPLSDALSRTDALLLYGKVGKEKEWGKPFFSVKLVSSSFPSAKAYIAFAGIGRPEKFFTSLREQGYPIYQTVTFPDHYQYDQKTLKHLLDLARDSKAQLITTEKDWVKLPSDIQPFIDILKVDVQFENKQVFCDWLLGHLQTSS